MRVADSLLSETLWAGLTDRAACETSYRHDKVSVKCSEVTVPAEDLPWRRLEHAHA